MLDAIRGWFKRDQGVLPDAPAHRQMTETAWPAVVYALADLHGCLAQLQALEAKIVVDAAAFEGEKWLVMLGDYIDRGPNSAGVIDHLLAPPPAGFRRICLTGNHEAMALDFFDNPRPGVGWLRFGGLETLQSYGLSSAAIRSASAHDLRGLLDSHIPPKHIAFIRQLRTTLALPGTLFVHAGIRPGIPLDRQSDDDLLWIRDDFISAPPTPGLRIVHGHTPASDPVVTPHRICIDTGAYATGILTSVRLLPDGSVKVLNSAP